MYPPGKIFALSCLFFIITICANLILYFFFSRQVGFSPALFGTSHCSVAGFACAEGVRLADERSKELCEAKSQEPERRNPLVPQRRRG